MLGEKRQIFRQESLERLSSPDQLDQLLQVVNPQNWLPLVTKKLGNLPTDLQAQTDELSIDRIRHGAACGGRCYRGESLWRRGVENPSEWD
jgi:hypothetical protein